MILITGMGRSGTTWLGKIFDSFPETRFISEPESEVRMDEIPTFILPGAETEYFDPHRQFVETFPALRTGRVDFS